jgi:hypothetical protein
MSKSKFVCRAWCCADSTMRSEASKPIAFRLSTQGEKMRTKALVVDQHFERERLPGGVAQNAALRFQPASAISRLRLAEQLAVAAAAVGRRQRVGSPKTSGGSLSRNGSSSASSSAPGARPP